MSIQKSAVLVQLNLGIWTARKFDKKATTENAERNDVAAGWSSVNKSLIAKDAIDKVVSAFQNVRWYFYAETRPWLKGIGILKNTNYDNFMKGFTEKKLAAEKAIDEFLPLYPSLRKDAEKYLGTMFNREDYPSEKEIARKFYISVQFMPVPDADAFMIEGLTGNDIDAIKQNIEDTVKQGLAESNRVTYEKFAEYVDRMIEKLSDGATSKSNKQGRQTFRDSLVDNLKELVDKLPALNIGDDPKLYELGKTIKEKLCKFDADELREDPKLRSEVKKRAEKVLKTMEGYY